jgi:hypothetical protein
MASAAGTNEIRPEQALQLFDLTPQASLRDLNHSYRILVRKYHPDRNPGRPNWSNGAMRLINAAYDIAVEYLAALRYQEVQDHLDRQIRAHDEFARLFANTANRVLDGVFTYYQYGLENPHQRSTGTPRHRYHQASRRIRDATAQLKRLQVPNQLDGETLELFTRFTVAFFEAMQLDRTHVQGGSRIENEAYRHYREGTRALDAAIRRTFFRAELAERELAAPQNLAVSLSELMTVVTRHREASWVTEAAVRLSLLDAFQALLRVPERLSDLGIEA